MSDAHPTRLSREELDAEAGKALPAKEVLSLLDLNVDLDLALDLAAPIDLAVAANANIAAPIDAAVSANILSEDSTSMAIAQQDAIITQTITGTAEATSDQTSDIGQGSIEPVDTDTASTDGTDGVVADAPTVDGSSEGDATTVTTGSTTGDTTP